jgi:methionine sulfoxide reductase heme-binding subunit
VRRSEPLHYLWWLVSRASGVVALLLISLSVLIGLAMAAKVLRRPGLKRAVARLHEHLALSALGAIALHGFSLLGDHWLRPGLGGITVPFAMGYRPAFTGTGIIAGYLAILVGPSFYLRRRLGAGRWRKLHRATVAVWALAVIHTLGAGSDGSKPWLRCVVLVPTAPVVYLLALRVLRARGRQPRPVVGEHQGKEPARLRDQRRRDVESAHRRAHRARQRPSVHAYSSTPAGGIVRMPPELESD